MTHLFRLGSQSWGKRLGWTQGLGRTWVLPREGDLCVEWRRRAEDIPEEAWTRCFRPPQEGRWIYATLERSGLEDQFSFAYALVMRDEAIIAIAPVFTAILPISIVAPDFISQLLELGGPLTRRLRHQKTVFVGSPCADEGHVGTAQDVELSDVAPLLQRSLRQFAARNGCANIVWKDFPQSASPTLAGLAGLSEIVSYPSTAIVEIPKDFESYLAGLSVKQRHNLRRKLRLSREAITLTTQIASEADDALIDEIWPLFQNTYDKAPTKFERLTETFWREVTAQPQTSLIVLRDARDGRAVAFLLACLEGRRAINKFIGMDYAQGARSFLYFRLWEEFLRWAMWKGATGVQSGQMTYEAKLDLGHELVPLSNFFRYRNPVLHLIASRVARSVSWGSLDETLRHRFASGPREGGSHRVRLTSAATR